MLRSSSNAEAVIDRDLDDIPIHIARRALGAVGLRAGLLNNLIRSLSDFIDR